MWNELATGEKHALVLLQPGFVAARDMDACWFQTGHSRVLEVVPRFAHSQRKPHGGQEPVVARVGQIGDFAGGQGMIAIGRAAAE